MWVCAIDPIATWNHKPVGVLIGNQYLMLRGDNKMSLSDWVHDHHADYLLINHHPHLQKKKKGVYIH